MEADVGVKEARVVVDQEKAREDGGRDRGSSATSRHRLVVELSLPTALTMDLALTMELDLTPLFPVLVTATV